MMAPALQTEESVFKEASSRIMETQISDLAANKYGDSSRRKLKG
jgi:hypothetical protein